ncbi:MAG: phosphate ABC transporter substrate-binding protein [Anaerolineae bacterium]|nr:phosphate ABC transporter substrate-binding protein [Anaerolineae bacterium]NIQ78688.1 phosphate ABC transporter substrate-binding protein [Anaerolineae bacterium]
MLRSRADRRRMVLALIVALIVIPGVPGCSSPVPAGQGATVEGGEVQGTIKVSGAWALYPMMVTWAEEFQKTYPRVRVDVSAGGAGKGVADALAKVVDIGMVSREIKPEEIAQGAFFVRVVKDAVFVTTNENNPVWHNLSARGVEKQTLIDLWINAEPMTWGEIARTDSDDIVNVYTRSDACGAAETLAKYLGGAQEDLAGTAVYGDPGLAEAVKTDRLAIGYNNLNYAYDASTGFPVAGLRVIPLDVNVNGRVDPDEDLSTKSQALEAILAGVYPSPPARDLYLMTKDEFQGLVGEFVRWILTDGQQYVEEAGYIRLTDAQIQESLEKVRD